MDVDKELVGEDKGIKVLKEFVKQILVLVVSVIGSRRWFRVFRENV